MNTLEETKYLLNKYNLYAKKKFGQNFLINDTVIESIIEKSNLDKNTLVIEIGPGLGTLTNKLLEVAKKVISIELDKDMVNILNDRFKFYDNFMLINEDCLKVDMEELIEKEKEQDKEINKVKIVANLPYYISTPIIMKLLEENLKVDEIVVMVQKEVADRLVGKNDIGAITYEVDYYSIASSLIDVDKTCFLPSPKVDSEVIKLEKRKEKIVDSKDSKLLFNLIKNSFNQRRKTLVNTLVNYFNNKQDAIKCLEDLGIDVNIRGEKLSLEEFNNIANYIYDNK